MQTEHAVQDMRLTKENSFLAAYPRQSRNNLICVTPYSSNCTV